ncbi:MAG: hypothetical protein WC279_08285 [Sulfurimonas sp.]|jgi:hypothetical protein|uniref:hypothetical protein n=1 Tax=Sulfurimonas sp. TaxID=2022749 RepID=UPI003567BEA1
MNSSEIFNNRFQKLQQEFLEIKKKQANKWKFKEHQQAIYDFVIHSRRFVEFEINGYVIVLKIGNDDFGFRHILLRHYCEGCDGELYAKDILNIGNVIKNDIELPSQKNRIKFIQNKGNIKYTVILTKESGKRLVFSYFSSESEKEISIIEETTIIFEEIIITE